MDFALLVQEEAAATGTGTGPGPSQQRLMRWRRQRRPFQAGDLAIMVEGHDSYVPVYLGAGQRYMSRIGAFHHDDVIGRPFGVKVAARPSASAAAASPPTAGGKPGKRPRFVRALLPNPELWTASLRHRTQICQDLDQAMVVFMLGLKPGAQVLESGTGTGAMSHSLMRAISPSGHLHTFEFNETRATMAREEFAKHQLAPGLVTVHHADICSEQPPPAAAALEGQMDAVFLDVPKPWLAVPLAHRVLKPNAPVATYSPCLEQVFKTCETLRAQGFHSVRTMEVRQKHLDVKRVSLPVVDFGSMEGRTAASAYNVFTAGAGAGAVTATADADAAAVPPEAEEEEGKEAVEEEGREQEEEEEEEGVVNGKRKRGSLQEGEEGGGRLVAKARPVMRGHTAFLTFAVKSLRAVAEKEEEGNGVVSSRGQEQEGQGEQGVVEMAPEA